MGLLTGAAVYDFDEIVRSYDSMIPPRHFTETLGVYFDTVSLMLGLTLEPDGVFTDGCKSQGLHRNCRSRIDRTMEESRNQSSVIYVVKSPGNDFINWDAER